MEVYSRICTVCKEEKLLSEFGPRKEGKLKKASWCHSCQAIKSHESRSKRNAKEPGIVNKSKNIRRKEIKTINENNIEEILSETNLKIEMKCVSCEVVSSRVNFKKDLTTTSGFSCICKNCSKIKNKIAYDKRTANLAENPSIERNLYSKENLAIDRKCITCKKILPTSEYYRNSKGKAGFASSCKICSYEISKQRWKLNPELTSIANAKRRAAKLNATPSWVDEEKIKEIYKEAIAISRSTGIKHEVDHIVPLRGKFVSGLHVSNNLRIIPSSENRSKNNKFIEELL